MLSTQWKKVLESEMRRFQIELVLQAIKSRGFVSLEAVDKVNRIAHHGQEQRRAAIEDLLTRKILSPAESSGSSLGPPGRTVPEAVHTGENYWLVPPDASRIADSLLELSDISDEATNDVLTLVSCDRKEAPKLVRAPKSLSKRLSDSVEAIQSAPDIEISAMHGRSTRWMFEEPELINSLETLAERSAEILHNLTRFSCLPEARLHGIWTTGEWLLHKDGWAYSPYGEDILARLGVGCIALNAIVARIPSAQTIRRAKAMAVHANLRRVTRKTKPVRQLSWWSLNRIMTVVQYRKAKKGPLVYEGIYMRRRHSTPVVSPVYVKGASDCQVLLQLFARYCRKVDADTGHRAAIEQPGRHRS